MAGLLKEIRDLPSAYEITTGGGDYLHIKQGDSDRKIRVFDLLKHHTEDYNNPHRVTKAQVLLGSVTDDPQLKIASNLSDLSDIATARTNISVYSKSESDSNLDTHTSRTDNPHSVTKTQVGLSLIENWNYSTSPTEASDTKYATIGAVKRAVDMLLAAKTDNTIFERGMIMQWNSNIAPDGWILCDLAGSQAHEDVPNLTNRFVVCSGGDYSLGDTGGAESITHNHSGTALDHILTVDEIPAHSHDTTIQVRWGNPDNNWTEPYHVRNGYSNTGSDVMPSSEVGGGQGHSHQLDVQNTTTENRPPYYGLFYIMKL